MWGQGTAPASPHPSALEPLCHGVKGRPHSQDPVVTRPGRPPYLLQGEPTQNLATVSSLQEPIALSSPVSPVLDSRVPLARAAFPQENQSMLSNCGSGREDLGTLGSAPRERLACTGSRLKIGMHSGPLSDSLTMGTAGTTWQRNGEQAPGRLVSPGGLAKLF